MRNISFDESTVLREYARIAAETQLIKTADNTLGPRQELDFGLLDPAADPHPNPVSLPAGTSPQDPKFWSALRKLMSEGEVNNFKQDLTGTMPNKAALFRHSQTLAKQTDHNRKQAYAILYPFIEKAFFDGKTKQQALAEFQQQGDAGTVSDTQYCIKMFNQLPSPTGTANQLFDQQFPQKADDGLTTSAADKAVSKVYDVSGETGEDLVDSAHPGNMKTELSHSKTDEALVETIVEKQEAILNVVHKMPKGTYATLVELYNSLHKQGKTEVLGDLLEVIKAVATPEDIIEHTLMSLANTLDEKGFTKAADKIDEIIRNNGEAFRPFERLGAPAPLVPEGERKTYWDPVRKEYTVPPIATKQYAGGIEDPSAKMSYPTTTPATSAAPVAGTSAKNPVQKFQQDYNKFKGQTALKEDGVLGPHTIAAWKELYPKLPVPTSWKPYSVKTSVKPAAPAATSTTGTPGIGPTPTATKPLTQTDIFNLFNDAVQYQKIEYTPEMQNQIRWLAMQMEQNIKNNTMTADQVKREVMRTVSEMAGNKI